jgi:16S rRNA (adenine1518-N6/adenine1519-N6)-dimethyltransferase
MDLLKRTKQLCHQYNIKPARTRGQNFLIREEVYDKIVKAANLKKSDIVLEVGPGLGFLTERIARRVKKVIAVELDDKLARALQARLEQQGIRNAEVVNGDILKIFNFQFSIFKQIQNSKLENQNYKIVANLPYNITSIFLRKILSAEFKPSLMVLMLQKEVAERIVAKPGKMSLLAVAVQFYAKPKIIQFVPASSFWPKPEVDSTIIKLEVIAATAMPRQRRGSAKAGPWAGQESKKFEVNEEEFFKLVRIGFSAKRKMLKNNLANGYHLNQEEVKNRLKMANFSLKIRAQELFLKDWIKLFGVFKKNML